MNSRPPDVDRPGSAAAQPGRESDHLGRRIESNGNAIAKSSQHSRRPDRYRLQVAPAWDLPGADAFRILDTHWGRK